MYTHIVYTSTDDNDIGDDDDADDDDGTEWSAGFSFQFISFLFILTNCLSSDLSLKHKL